MLWSTAHFGVYIYYVYSCAQRYLCPSVSLEYFTFQHFGNRKRAHAQYPLEIYYILRIKFSGTKEAQVKVP